MAGEARAPSIRWGRILWTLGLLGVLAAGLYAASWMNARRFFLVVGATEARVERGRMLPYGRAPFVPPEPELRRAYSAVPLLGGATVAHGESVFTERVELDQALFSLLRSLADQALRMEHARARELLPAYLEQARRIPGISLAQQRELEALERSANYRRAGERRAEGVQSLLEAARMFREAARGGAPDAAAQAAGIERALTLLAASVTSTAPATRTTTTGTASRPRAQP